MPRTGLPSPYVTSAIAAITAARRTLGSGVTSTTKPTSTTSATPTRRPRGNPATPPTRSTKPITIAQLAPETAVRWLRELLFMAASSWSSTRVVSPIARPDSGRPPEPGSPAAWSRNAARSSPAHRIHSGAGPSYSTSPSGNTRKARSSPRSVGAIEAVAESVSPTSARRSGAPPNTITGTSTVTSLTRRSLASKLRAPGITDSVAASSTRALRCDSTTSVTASGYREGDWIATDVTQSAAVARARATTATSPTRRDTTTQTPAAAHSAAATTTTSTRNPITTAVATQATAAGIASRASSITSSPDPAARRRSSGRYPSH